jgi:hypothetical protein
MTFFDTIIGDCPYCNQKSYIQTNICSDENNCYRDFYIGNNLPIMNKSNYYGDTLPNTFLWKLKDLTSCCKKKVFILIYNKKIGNFVSSDNILRDVLIYDEYQKNEEYLGWMRYLYRN